MLQTVKHTAMTNKTSPLFFPVYLILMLLFSACAQHVSLYVSPTGDDANVGTKGQPLRSLEGARKAVRVVLKESREPPSRSTCPGGYIRLPNPLSSMAKIQGANHHR